MLKHVCRSKRPQELNIILKMCFALNTPLNAIYVIWKMKQHVPHMHEFTKTKTGPKVAVMKA